MKVFARFKGVDQELVTDEVYLIHVYSRSEHLRKLNVRIADSWWQPYENHTEFENNWVIL